MSGKLKTDGVITRKMKLEEWEQAFKYAEGKEGDLKVVLIP
jgi:threonine dehydrogenase-like Zn-dependent dehydrogenase